STPPAPSPRAFSPPSGFAREAPAPDPDSRPRPPAHLRDVRLVPLLAHRRGGHRPVPGSPPRPRRRLLRRGGRERWGELLEHLLPGAGTRLDRSARRGHPGAVPV